MLVVVAKTLFFYDLETSSLNPRVDRIMQFAGQRTDLDLTPLGEPYNIFVRLNDDTLPSPEAVIVTGITPQMTLENGVSEAEFAKILTEEIFTQDTITVGFNNIRFDDEFIRGLLWRNFHDPYEWAWKDGRSRWDMLDVVRMTRALRPEGIKWPVVEGVATNRLELLSAENGLHHIKAHDALSDVEALIAVARLLKDQQPQLYSYLFRLRDKNEVKKLVNLDEKRPFVYVSGRYDSQWHKATVAFPLTAAKNGNVVVYDLRHDPTEFVGLSTKALSKKLYASREDRKKDGFVSLPTKELQYNRAPAVAPLGVLEQAHGWERIGVDPDQVEKHKKVLLEHPDFAERLRELYENKPEYKKSPDPEAALYDGFLNDRDRLRTEAVRNASLDQLADFSPDFGDERLPELLLHYKARSFPTTLSEDESLRWEKWRAEHIRSQLEPFAASLQQIVATNPNEKTQFLLQELQLWAESIVAVEY